MTKPKTCKTCKTDGGPFLRLQLTDSQARQLDEAKPAGDSVIVMGYAARHSWPNPERFSLVLAFCSFSEATKACEQIGLVERRRPFRTPRRKRSYGNSTRSKAGAGEGRKDRPNS